MKGKTIAYILSGLIFVIILSLLIVSFAVSWAIPDQRSKGYVLTTTAILATNTAVRKMLDSTKGTEFSVTNAP